MLAAKLLAGGGAETLYAEDVFSAYTYTGNGGSQTITNGIDLAGSGGLVWVKSRSAANGNLLSDTAQGTTKFLISNTTGAQQTDAGGVTAFNSNGFSLGSSTGFNGSPNTQVAWTFRKAPKFFDVVTFTATASTNQRISHSLGQSPGMIIAKRTDNTSQWEVYHRSIGRDSYIWLNDTGAAGSYAGRWGTSDPTSTDFGINGTSVFGAGTSWVAYLFAHDTSTDGLIQCGSFTTDGDGTAPIVTLGWEPQYVMIKRTNSSSAGDWQIWDSSRGFVAGSQTSYAEKNSRLFANTSAAEDTTHSEIHPTSTGFLGGYLGLGTSSPYIYLAIRRPNKPPTTGTQVYNAIARTGTGAAATVTGVGFAPDLVIPHRRSINGQRNWFDRLRGAQNYFNTSENSAESLVSNGYGLIGFDEMDGVRVGTGTDGYVNQSGTPYINHFFKRAPGVFDVVCYTGTGSATTVAHGLGAVPELMIVKGRGNSNNWEVYYGNPTTAARISLNTTTSNAHFSGLFNDTAPTASVFTVGTSSSTNQVSINFVAYLFATLAGISKVFSYTGNGGTAGSAGTSQTINCGFTTGARFVMLKCTSHTSDWVVVDTTRGLIAGNDPALSLNTTAAEVTTTDLLDPDISGFIVNQLATGTTSADFNVTGRTYIGLAFS